MSLQYDAHGMLCLQPWIDMHLGSPKELATTWWRAMLDERVMAADATRVSLAEDLITLSIFAWLKPL